MSKNFNSLVIENGGFESFSFGERDCRNFINMQESFGLVKEVPRHIVIISVECKSIMVAFTL